MNILSIETSCDETAIAILKCSGGLRKPSFEILANEVSSQIKIHRPFGGVVPNLAKREHIKNLPKIYQKIKKEVIGLEKKIDLIAVTVGPGLEPALWTGINFAENLAKELKKPLIGVNHMEGHLYGFLLSQKTENPNDKLQITKKMFPVIGLVVSGGHTIILKMQSLTKWEKLGETVDDAAGEAFDKVARILSLQYPGGPEIEKLAKQGNPKAITFPRPMLNQHNYDFSFSGLKTSVLYYVRDHLPTNAPKWKADLSTVALAKADIAASFQQAAIDVLTKKTMRAAEEFSARSVILCGGVACNKTLRETIKKESERRGLDFFAPEMKFNTDNAAMIGAAAYIHSLAKKRVYKIEADSNLNL
ncbi:MAG: tRNA (adenosine(37)-N6)-threonylcarbamoyltransferase complex transferase subunit TsaD [bacterium]|nr:tRNA (adenosine(37)-N6)-threonylcarbamoyltransferase complex transferase subunit TsaD [bacterium]